MEQYFVEDTVVKVFATCILRKGRPDLVHMKTSGCKLLEPAMRIKKKQRTKVRIDLCSLQDGRKMPEEIFRADLRKRGIGDNGRGGVVHQCQIDFVQASNFS